jgi:hypothetical protein
MRSLLYYAAEVSANVETQGKLEYRVQQRRATYQSEIVFLIFLQMSFDAS